MRRRWFLEVLAVPAVLVALQARADASPPPPAQLTIDVSDAARAIPGLSIRSGDAVLSDAAWGKPIVVERGETMVVATAPHHRPFFARVYVDGTESSLHVVIPALRDVDAKERPSAIGTTQRTISLATSAAGVIAIGFGLGAGYAASKEWMTFNNYGAVTLVKGRFDGCHAVGLVFSSDAHLACTRDAWEHAEVAHRRATLANVLVTGGAVLATAGIVAYWMAPREKRPGVALTVSPDHAGLTVRGAF